MKVLVFGAGALGSVLGALLSRRQNVLLVTRGEHLEAIKKEGLTIDGLIHENFQLSSDDSSSLKGKYDIILVTTKAYATEEAANACKDLLSEGGVVMTVQNGIGNAEKLAKVFGREKVVAGVTSMAAHRIRPGTVNYVAEGEILIGSLTNDPRPMKVIEEAFKKTRIRTVRSENITGAIWSKAIVNAAINTLTTVFDVRNGAIAENPVLRNLAMNICEEGMGVAKAWGIRLEPPDVSNYMLDIAKRTAANKSSMTMDIELKRRTEIDAISGIIIEAGRSKGVETPTISRLYTIVKFLESRDSLLRKLNMQT